LFEPQFRCTFAVLCGASEPLALRRLLRRAAEVADDRSAAGPAAGPPAARRQGWTATEPVAVQPASRWRGASYFAVLRK